MLDDDAGERPRDPGGPRASARGARSCGSTPPRSSSPCSARPAATRSSSAALELRLRAQTEPTDRAATLRAIAVVEDEQLGRPLEAEAGAAPRARGHAGRRVAARGDRAARRAHGRLRPLLRRARAARRARSSTRRSRRTCSCASAASPRRSSRTTGAASRPTPRPSSTPATRPSCSRRSIGSTAASATPRRSPTCSSGASRSSTGDREQADLYHRLAVIQIEVVRRQAPGPGHAAPGARARGRSRAGASGARGAHRRPGRSSTRRPRRSRASTGRGATTPRWRASTRSASASRRRGAERVRMRLDLARVLEERSNDPKAAQETLEKALADDPSDADVLARDRAPRPDHRRLGERRRRPGARRSAPRTELDGDTARDLWMRIAEWRKDKVGDADGRRARVRGRRSSTIRTSEHILRVDRGAAARPGPRARPRRHAAPARRARRHRRDAPAISAARPRARRARARATRRSPRRSSAR